MASELQNFKVSIINRLAAEKKKTFVAVALVGLMIFMWSKLLFGQKPQTASALLDTQSTAADNNNTAREPEIEFVDLPFEKGRNDILVRDFFSIADAAFSPDKQVNILSQGGNEQNIQIIAGMLKLDAIGMAPKPEAFINDRLVKVGDVLKVSDGSKEYDCEIVKIDETKVLVKFGKTEIELKLEQADTF